MMMTGVVMTMTVMVTPIMMMVVTMTMMVTIMRRRRRKLLLVWMANQIAITQQIHLLCQVGPHQMMVVSRIVVIAWKWLN